MKSKHKPLPLNTCPASITLIKNRTINKRHSQHQNFKNHFPISSTKLSSHQNFNQSHLTNYPNYDPNRSSPYLHLPSWSSDSKSLQSNSSKVSENQQSFNTNGESIYDQIVGNSEIKGYRKQNQQHIKNNLIANHGQNQQKAYTNYKEQQQKFSSQKFSFRPVNNFSKRQNQTMQYQYAQQGVNANNNIQLMNTKISQQLIKKQINDRLDRVCEKIQNLSVSREKEQRKKCEKHKNQERKQNIYCQADTETSFKTQLNNTSQLTPKGPQKLCYSSIVYEPTTELSVNISSMVSNFTSQEGFEKKALQQKRNDMNIQQRIVSPHKPNLTQIQQTRIIELQRKVTLQHGRMIRLQEELLIERQKLIRKEKEWLLRQNQLLSWIEENEKQLELYKLDLIQYSPKHELRKNVVIQNKSATKPNRCSHYSASKSYQKYKISQNNNKQKKNYQNINDDKKIDPKLLDIFKNILKIIKLSQNWVTLINRNFSSDSSKTLFTLKEDMNINFNFFQKVENQCKAMLYNAQDKQKDPKNVQVDNSSCYPYSYPFSNQSETFLLQSYCPPISQRYQVSTKRNNSTNKPQSFRKVNSISESKSTTSKKSNLNQTQKKYVKTKNNLEQQAEPQIISKIKSLSESYCDQVFYEKTQGLKAENIQVNIVSECSTDFYYVLSLQAMALEGLMNPVTANKSQLSSEQDLLCDDSQLLQSVI